MKRAGLLWLGLLFAVLNGTAMAFGQGGWMVSGDLNVTRISPLAACLDDGRVLVVGGRFDETRCELWDPESGQWQLTGSLATGRTGSFDMVKLQDGRVLVLGGIRSGQPALASCEIYDPKKGLWSSTGSMNDPRQNPVAVLLDDGRILVAGGWNLREQTLNSSEIYDPDTEQWTRTAPMNVKRTGHRALRLPDGRVLVTGGVNQSFSRALETCEIYDPESGTWSLVAAMNQFRRFHRMALLQNGKVLVVGGYEASFGTVMTDICEEYDAAKDEWTRVSDINMDAASATTLLDGRVLITGWRIFRGGNPTFNNVRLYDPDSGAWDEGREMPLGRYDLYAFTLLPEGAVLLVGGRKDWDADEANLQRTSIVYVP